MPGTSAMSTISSPSSRKSTVGQLSGERPKPGSGASKSRKTSSMRRSKPRISAKGSRPDTNGVSMVFSPFKWWLQSASIRKTRGRQPPRARLRQKPSEREPVGMGEVQPRLGRRVLDRLARELPGHRWWPGVALHANDRTVVERARFGDRLVAFASEQNLDRRAADRFQQGVTQMVVRKKVGEPARRGIEQREVAIEERIELALVSRHA